jgi:hypothetical protein
MADTKRYKVEILGYKITSPDDPTFETEMNGISYNMDAAGRQAIQQMFLDMGAQLKAVGDAALTPEQKTKHDQLVAALRVGKR